MIGNIDSFNGARDAATTAVVANSPDLDNGSTAGGPAPTVVIDPSGRFALDLRELWAHRDLLYFLTQRDIKLRYRQTLLGVIWAVLQPVLPMIVFTLLFGRLAHVPSEGMPYPIFVYAGLLPWTFFNSSVANATTSLVGNALLITKVYFPRLVIPGAVVAAGLIDFGISTVILGCLMVYYHVHATWNLFLLPPLVLLTTMLTFALGLWMSALNVRYRDLRFALPFALQILLYVTPVIYPVNFIPKTYRWALILNPLSGLIQGYRSAFLGRPIDWSALSLAAVIATIILGLATHSFRNMERELADII